ncbi:MAG: pseudouridine synthase, partial [Patescibacteria group bacterium]
MPIHPDRILYEDDHFLAVAKLPRELVVKGSGPVERLPLLDFLKKSHPGLRPANRLDFEASGVVLFAKTKAALAAAMAQQKKGAWIKTYRTIVMGHMKADQGEITKPLPARMGGGEAHA